MPDNTSTLQSYIDSVSTALTTLYNAQTLTTINRQASGIAQSALGSLTGNTADKVEADKKKSQADAEHAASKAGTSVGGVSISSSGVAANDPERQKGSWDQTIGSAKETVGGLIGNQSLKNEGREQNAAGQGREAAGQVSDLGKGVADRVSGSVQGGFASLTGNTEAKLKADEQHATGKVS